MKKLFTILFIIHSFLLSAQVSECAGTFVSINISYEFSDFIEESSFEILSSDNEVITSVSFNTLYEEMSTYPYEDYIIDSVCLETGEAYTFNSFDSYGDGWVGATYTITSNNCNSPTLLASNNYSSPTGPLTTETFIAYPCGTTIGCEDPLACNYLDDPDVIEECFYTGTYYNCWGECINDIDNNNICDENDILGCTNIDANNFNPLATSLDNSCEFDNYGILPSNEVLETNLTMTVLFILPDSLSANSTIYVISPTGLTVGVSENIGAFIPIAVFMDDLLTPEIDGAVMGDVLEFQFENNGAIYSITLDETITFLSNSIEVIENYTVTYNYGISTIGCTDNNAFNYYAAALTDDGSCEYPVEYYNCSGNCINDVDDDGICDEYEIPGCGDPYAANYISSSTELDNCEYITCDDNLNFAEGNPSFYTASIAIEANLLPSYLQDITSYIGAFTQDDFGVYSCIGMSEISSNIAFIINGDNPSTPEIEGAFENQLYSIYAVSIEGHLFQFSGVDDLNYANSNAYNINIGAFNYSCYQAQAFMGCTDPEACNYNETENNIEDCIYPELYYNCEGWCENDINMDGICDEFQQNGCTDSLACNFSVEAITNDGSCTYANIELIYNQLTNTIHATVGGEIDYFYFHNWYLNGQLLEGENENSYTPSTNGIYTFETAIDVENPDVNDHCLGSDSIQITSLKISEIEDLIEVYPNPSNNFITINFEKGETCIIEIYSSIGEIVHFAKLSDLNNKIPVTHLSNGLYFVKLTRDNYSSVHKIRIQH